MDQAGKGPLPIFVLEDVAGLLVGIARMHDQWQARLARRHDVGAEALGLLLARAVFVEEIEPGFADADYLGMARGLDQAPRLWQNVSIEPGYEDALEAVLLDVAAPDRKPSNFPEGRLWLPVHPSIPGAVWMPEAGAEPLAPAREALSRWAAMTSGWLDAHTGMKSYWFRHASKKRYLLLSEKLSGRPV